jgi:hypothetical protein
VNTGRAGTLIVSGWFQAGSLGSFTNVALRTIYSPYKSSEVIELNVGDPTWYYLEVELKGSDMWSQSGSQLPFAVGNYDSYTYQGGAGSGRNIRVSDLKITAMGYDGVSTVTSWQP